MNSCGNATPGTTLSTSRVVMHSCKFCDKTFSNRSNLKKHIRNLHGVAALQNFVQEEANIPSKKRTLACDLCPKIFATLRGLRQHHESEHNFEVEVETLTFDTYAGKKPRSIILSIRKENSPGVFRRYLNCHRSGTYIELPTKLCERQIKVQGSSKIDIHCFAMLEVTERDNKVFVVFQKNHYGHLDEIAHQRLFVAEKKVIAGRLAEGVPPKTILQKNQGRHKCS
ncbi:uncharacterized protein LOC125942852 [Dermacentor silvarum]|uniref:uncharacterized protein LOC125942852 n=1 Tax=Dermacentor silvarum TaxID=543639 RepID=UPI002100707C|nr:uncharacterized protein LOC125942852 [Dermacentor silvarum]